MSEDLDLQDEAFKEVHNSPVTDEELLAALAEGELIYVEDADVEGPESFVDWDKDRVENPDDWKAVE